MGNPILVRKSENIFQDKFEKLSMKDIGMELKHYRMGTAPENPSFVANQDVAKNIIIERFRGFFELGMGLEMPILISHIGDGKTHFIRMIFDAFKDIPNVKARRVYLRDEEIDIKIKILEAIDRLEIKKCVNKIINDVSFAKLKLSDSIMTSLREKFDISENLAKVLINANSKDVYLQTKAIQVLKGNVDAKYLTQIEAKDFFSSSEDFYFGFLKILCKYLETEGIYVIIVFDELEHVLDWKDVSKTTRFFRNIKEFTDQMTIYPNLFMMLAATQVYKDKDIFEKFTIIEPATYDRMKSQFIKLEDISSDEEVINLINYLKVRYEKFYLVTLNTEEVSSRLKMNLGNRNIETTYRSYSQEIMKIFDELKKESMTKDVEVSEQNEDMPLDNENEIDISAQEKNISILKEIATKKWMEAPSPIANKSLLVMAVEKFLKHLNYKLLHTDKKYGFILLENKEGKRQLYYILYTSKTDNRKLFDDKFKEAQIIKERNSAENICFIYPEYLLKTTDKKWNSNKKTKFVAYNVDTIIDLLALLDENADDESVRQICDNYRDMVIK